MFIGSLSIYAFAFFNCSESINNEPVFYLSFIETLFFSLLIIVLVLLYIHKDYFLNDFKKTIFTIWIFILTSILIYRFQTFLGVASNYTSDELCAIIITVLTIATTVSSRFLAKQLFDHRFTLNLKRKHNFFLNIIECINAGGLSISFFIVVFSILVFFISIVCKNLNV